MISVELPVDVAIRPLEVEVLYEVDEVPYPDPEFVVVALVPEVVVVVVVGVTTVPGLVLALVVVVSLIITVGLFALPVVIPKIGAPNCN